MKKIAQLVIWIAGACVLVNAQNPDCGSDDNISQKRKTTIDRNEELKGYIPSEKELHDSAVKVEKKVYYSEDKKKIKLVRFKTFRGQSKIKDRVEMDSNDDGELDYFQEIFYVNNESCASLSWTRGESSFRSGRTISLEAHSKVSCMFMDKDSDGVHDELLIMGEESELMDLFRRNEDGILHPVDAEEYLKTKKSFQAVAPMANGMIEGIQGASEKADPKDPK